MPAAADRRWTAVEVRALLDELRPGPRYELVDGELLVTPSPRPLHQTLVEELFIALRGFALGENPLVIDLPALFRLAWGE